MRTSLKIIAIMQLAMCASIFLDIPVLRQVLGFVFLTFLPGFIILMLLKIDAGSRIENVLFSIGLSIAFVMFFGFLWNSIVPVFGLENPLANFWVVASFVIVGLVLLALFALANRGSIVSFKRNEWSTKFSISIALIGSIPLAAIVGAEMVNIFGNSIFLLLFILLICAVLICSTLTKIIPHNLFPMIVFAISFFLIFHIVLSSNYLIGWDIHGEYYFANLASTNSFWDRTIPSQFNSMVSVTILPVIFSNFLNLNLNWVFKLVYALIYSLVPVVLFLAIKKKTSSRIALLSVFFFMAFAAFYGEILGIARQMMAEFFFSLLILLLVSDQLSFGKRNFLFLALGTALIMSHYALSYIFMIFLLFVVVLSPFFKSAGAGQIKTVSNRIILLYSVITLSWSFLVSPGLSESLLSTVTRIYNSILQESFGLTIGEGGGNILPGYTSPLHNVSTYLFLLMQFLVLVGVFWLIAKRKSNQFGAEYSSMTIAAIVMMILAILIPAFAYTIGTGRFYQISLFFLAPFCILGALTLVSIFEILRSRLRKSLKPCSANLRKFGLLVLSILLILYLLFQVGFVYEISGDVPSSISLSRDKIDKWPTSLHDLYIDDGEFASAKWMKEYSDNISTIYIDSGNRYVNSYGQISLERIEIMNPGVINEYVGSYYILFGRQNMVYGIIQGDNTRNRPTLNITDYSDILSGINQVYSNGESAIYRGVNP